ncbi:2-(1,2-epoxy-1,2-dihydrophenyl)acetyl-CoA isomerase PaaG [Aquisalimonas sp.]|uniref:2-(1,2-epoxy-1,2-dihydrophenyl)acetyl-CoA isomerase PaaG n=1 Tax=unclassified Aquisalimonas TaxID=2644645 RepID=UPI0025BE473B|nr:2-(1,2-epoxy-1,2-dihydrophenyl)acetyl-CoA isomerase PaaG [Aquisalimonas sp.]
MAFETIEFSVESGIGRLALSRPDSLNSFNVEMHEEIQQALDVLERTEGLRVLLVTGRGRAFCAGQDLSDRSVAPGDQVPDLGESLERYYNPMIRRLRALPVPVVCAVNGVAAGAGANIALACDIVLAARSAKFAEVFCNIGLVPDSGGTWHLPRLVGHARAMALSMLGGKVSAEQAEQWGMIWRVVDDDALEREAEDLLEHFARQPTRGLAHIKQALAASWTSTLDEQLDLERDLQRACGRTADYREGVTAFMEKRKPEFTGR